jgi:hypothetical protein
MSDKIKPDQISSLMIPRGLFEATWNYLQTRGREDLEGVAYWTGDATPTQGLVAHVLYPDAYAEESAIHIEVAPGTVMKLAERIHDLDEFLLARIHSHPGEAFHSPTDDHGCLSGRVGMLSVVIPDFARGMPTLSTAVAYERTTDGRWRELGTDELSRRFEVR